MNYDVCLFPFYHFDPGPIAFSCAIVTSAEFIRMTENYGIEKIARNFHMLHSTISSFVCKGTDGSLGVGQDFGPFSFDYILLYVFVFRAVGGEK